MMAPSDDFIRKFDSYDGYLWNFIESPEFTIRSTNKNRRSHFFRRILKIKKPAVRFSGLFY